MNNIDVMEMYKTLYPLMKKIYFLKEKNIWNIHEN